MPRQSKTKTVTDAIDRLYSNYITGQWDEVDAIMLRTILSVIGSGLFSNPDETIEIFVLSISDIPSNVKQPEKVVSNLGERMKRAGYNDEQKAFTLDLLWSYIKTKDLLPMQKQYSPTLIISHIKLLRESITKDYIPHII
jgi:hypothetical protein